MEENIFRLGEGSESFVDGEDSYFTEDEVVRWADAIVIREGGQTGAEGKLPKNIFEALFILKSANEFLYLQ